MKQLFQRILLIILLLSKGYSCKVKFEIKKEKSNISRKLYHCYKSCKECFGPAKYIIIFLYDHNCKSCKEGYYKLGETNCYNNEIKNEGYYLHNNKWEKCYEMCRTCSGSGDSSNMNCLSCKNSMRNNIKYRLDNNNCVSGCQDDNYYSVELGCSDHCPAWLYSYSVDHTCLTDCP